MVNLERILEQEHLTHEILNLTRSFKEEVYAFLLGEVITEGKEVIIDTLVPVLRGTHESIPISPEDIAETISPDKFEKIVGIFHNHPNASAKPSTNDLRHLSRLEKLLNRQLVLLISYGLTDEIACVKTVKEGVGYISIPRQII